jgi:hypothetical protein
MEEPKYRKYYLDWWRYGKAPFTLIAILLIVGTVLGGLVCLA